MIEFAATRARLSAVVLLAVSLLATGCAATHHEHRGEDLSPRLVRLAPRDLSAERLEALTRAVQSDIDRGRIPGAVMLIARDGRVVYERALGRQDPKAATPMRADALFRIYSMTKPIVSVAAMMLVERGRMQLADPVSRYLPEFKNLKVGVERAGADGKPTLELVPMQREMTVQDLLRHTSGLTYGVFGKSLVKSEYGRANIDANDITNDELVKRLANVPLQFQPGSTWEYGRSTDVLGAVIERISGQPLDQFLRENILTPLKMVDTDFWVDPARQPRIAEAFDKDPDSSAEVKLLEIRSKPSYLAGGQGLVSTARDYLRFAQMMLNGGQLDGVRIIARKTARYMMSDHLGAVRGPAFLPGPGYGFGLGFAVRLTEGESNVPGTVGDAHWSGFGGTTFWVDPRERMVAILMTQGPNQRLYTRTLFRNMVYAAFE
jgi:CubicO group peptidase (beta-lactamase class C family)